MQRFLPLSLLIAVLAACSASVETGDVDAVLELEGDAVSGSTLYVEHCERCHAEDGAGINAVDFSEFVPGATDEAVVEAILSGPGYMPNFVNSLDSQQVADIVTHLRASWPE